ncbi:hypothetical protein Tco_1252911 [Tanacetum coccineum]
MKSDALIKKFLGLWNTICLLILFDQEKNEVCCTDSLENDWWYMAVTAFLVKLSGSRTSVCFIVVACSDATVTLRAPAGLNWKPILDKFQNRLSSWKAKTLSYGGRHAIIKLVLGALGTYYFSLFKAPKYVIDYMRSLDAISFGEGHHTPSRFLAVPMSERHM